jgi:hypothetical protein
MVDLEEEYNKNKDNLVKSTELFKTYMVIKLFNLRFLPNLWSLFTI